MKKLLLGLIAICLLTVNLNSQEGFKGRPITSNVWMQSGYTLHGGEIMIGLGPIAFGVTENVQLETNLLLFFLQFYNASAKVSIFKEKENALAVGATYLHFDLGSLIDLGDNNLTFDAIQPFITYTTSINDKFKVHAGATYSYFSGDAEIEDAKASSNVTGTSVSAGLEYSISNKTKILGDCAYDITFKGIRPGAAVLFGWETFRLKLGLGYYSMDKDDFVLPVIDLWWRFSL
ncbi:hypothetical protein D9V86_07480 [Bacteroidetes/Chlorobi group bacterium ChocPot_Mid]|nr:MAG: hypothetical protein D9V86_07480 [Bacteroidetes/Chlorobi group bacterium ChocPot_Mid]